jgi:hypothetical protein
VPSAPAQCHAPLYRDVKGFVDKLTPAVCTAPPALPHIFSRRAMLFSTLL